MPICPCGSLLSFEQCCGPLHRGESNAPTAERLMRSRYSAFVRRDEAYLLRTWHSRTRPRVVELDPGLRWTSLDVLEVCGGSLFDVEATVLFEAHYVLSMKTATLRENSRFVREQGVWLYVGP